MLAHIIPEFKRDLASSAVKLECHAEQYDPDISPDALPIELTSSQEGRQRRDLSEQARHCTEVGECRVFVRSHVLVKLSAYIVIDG